jgi:thiol-disulfide isomerase/thioredoxin
MLDTRLNLNRFYLIATLSYCLLLAAACSNRELVNSNQRTVRPAAPPSTTFPMPPLSGASLGNMGWKLSDGKHNVFSEYKGKVLVLDFYATWCVPCRDSIPHLIDIQKKFKSEGVVVIGLNVGGPGDPERASNFARELGIQYPLATPDDDLVSFLLSGNDAIPQTFVFDRQGQLVERFIGFGASTAERIKLAVESALQTP